MISLVTMATNVDSKLLTIVFLFLSGTDHSVKVSSNSESVRAGALLEFFGGYRELMLNTLLHVPPHPYRPQFIILEKYNINLSFSLDKPLKATSIERT